jgi:hypothetical protein
MNDFSVVMLFLVLLSVASCRMPASQDTDELVSHFRFEPEAFDSFFGVSRAQYSLREASVTSLSIVKRSDHGQNTLVMTLFENLYESKGTHKHVWLGDTRDGIFAPSGIYVGVLQIGSLHFEAVVRVYHR